MTKYSIRSVTVALFAALALPAAAHAQTSQRGQPRSAFGLADFAKLRWLTGTWEASSPGESTIYQKYVMTSDSTIDITYYTDPALTHATGSGRVYLSVGRVYHSFGPGRWGATHVDTDGVYFVPQVNARNTFAWTPTGPDSWTATQRSGASGRERAIVSTMKRIR
jgi:hypothetical protein